MRCKICSNTFRIPPPRMRESQICTACQDTLKLKNKSIQSSKTNYIQNVKADDIYISRGQAGILKIIMNLIPKNETFYEITLRNVLEQKPEIIFSNSQQRLSFLDFSLTLERSVTTTHFFFIKILYSS